MERSHLLELSVLLMNFAFWFGKVHFWLLIRLNMFSRLKHTVSVHCIMHFGQSDFFLETLKFNWLNIGNATQLQSCKNPHLNNPALQSCKNHCKLVKICVFAICFLKSDFMLLWKMFAGSEFKTHEIRAMFVYGT